MSQFSKGDKVAWSQVVATEHGAGSIARQSVIASRDQDAQYGTIVGASKDYPNAYVVRFGKDDEKTLTFEEIVKVDDES